MSNLFTCPHCGHTYQRRTPAEIQRTFEANMFYYEVGSGIAWAPPRVVFAKESSARKFKQKYPEFDVRLYSGNQYIEVN